jgi:hypothetical protein
MRDFFINSLEILVGVFVVLIGLAVLAFAAMAAFGGGMGPGAAMGPMGGASGPLAAVGILIGGALYVIFVGGFMYMGIGIYQNTKRSAEALEKLASR